MNPIEAEALDLLEWPRLAEHLASFASTRAGARHCRSLAPAASCAESARLLCETTELLGLDGVLEGGLSFQGVADLGGTLQYCSKGGTASGEALLEVATTLAAGRRLRRQIDDEDLRPVTSALVQNLRTLPELEQRLRFCIEEGGRVADRASPALAALRLQLSALRQQRRERLQELMRRFAPLLQDNVIAERNGRPVLAVKAGAASQLSGLVHDSSASGNTVFIEPQAVIALGNRLRELEGEQRDLEQQVLAELSVLVAADADALHALHSVLVQLDGARGCAYGGVPHHRLAVAARREHNRNAIASKLDHVAAMLVHGVDHVGQEGVDGRAHALGAVGQRGELLRQRREAGGVCEDGRRREGRAHAVLAKRDLRLRLAVALIRRQCAEELHRQVGQEARPRTRIHARPHH